MSPRSSLSPAHPSGQGEKLLDAARNERERLQAELARAERNRAAASVVAESYRRASEELLQRRSGELMRLERALDAMVMHFTEADRERMLLARRGTEMIARYDHLRVCLYASQALFDATFGEAPIGMALLGRDGGIRSANAALCRLTGHSREALEAAEIQRIMGPDERSGLDATLLQLRAAEHTSVRSERSLLCADGRVRRVSLTISAVDNREEQPVELVAHLLDLSRSPETPEELLG